MPWTPELIRSTHDILFGEPEHRLLRRTEGGWLIRFDGGETSLPDYVGLTYYAALLARPHEPIGRVELAQLAGRGEVREAERDDQLSATLGGSLRDGIAPAVLEELKRIPGQIQELEEERDLLVALGRQDEAARADAEAERLRGVAGLYAPGRERDDSAPAEKARRSVDEALRYARERIAERGLPELAAYLGEWVRCRRGAFAFRPPAGDPGWRVEADFLAGS